MKKITVCLLFLLVLVAVSSFGQELGQKVYREVTINGEVVKKWVKVIGIEDYDERGKALYEKDIDGFTQYEYDDKGNEIHWIWQTGKDRYEYWYEYDDQNRKIHQSETKPKKNSFKGTWYEYDDKGNLIREVDKDRTGKKITGEVLYENDGEGKLIHKKISYNETYYEYNKQGNLIHKTSSNGDEEWYEYDTKGNKVHLVWKTSTGKVYEHWYEYDEKHRLIHTDNKSAGEHLFFSYEEWPNGNIKRRIKYESI